MSKAPRSKTAVIAWREYLAAVRTKGFIIGIILMPLLMGGGLILQGVTQNIVDLTPRVCEVIDRTPDHQLYFKLQTAALAYNAGVTADPGKKSAPKPPLRFNCLLEDPKARAGKPSGKLRKGERSLC